MKLRVITTGCVLAFAGLPALASGEGGGGGAALLQPKVGTIFWTALTFLIMLFILGRFAWKPLLAAMDARSESIQDSLDKAARDREEAAAQLKEHQALVAEARRERAEALTQGQRDAEKVRAEILDQAKQEREHLLKQTQAQIEVGLQQARGELRAMAADLAIQGAQKLLSANLDDAAQRKLVEDYLAEIERSGGPSGLPS